METNIIRIIDDSTFPATVKAELKQLATALIDARNEDSKVTAALFKAKQGINERQYSKRLQQATGDKRNQVLIEQFAWRDWFVNGVLRTHEVRCRRQSLAAAIAEAISSLLPQSDSAGNRALVALSVLVRSEKNDADVVLEQLSSVRDLTRKQALDAVRTLFSNLKEQAGTFWGTNFSSQPFKIANATEEQTSLSEAVDTGIAAYYEFNALGREFEAARSRLNVPQFTQRLEEALATGEADRFEQIGREQRDCEATLYVAASCYEQGFAAFSEAKQKLATAIRLACATLKDNGDLDSIKFMSNCNGAQHWLHEMGYIESMYRRSNPAGVLAEMNFDALDYVESVKV